VSNLNVRYYLPSLFTQGVVLKGILKWPLIIAALVVVLRIVVERGGGPGWLASSLSIVALHTLLAPIYFASRISKSAVERPYASLFKLILIYALLTRAMLIPVYWLARIYEWPEPRFYGLFGPEIGPVTGFIAVPFLTAAFWIVTSIVVGGGIGSAVLAVLRSKSKAVPNT
jgi:hypothetical protein